VVFAGVATKRLRFPAWVICRMILHHEDGRVEGKPTCGGDGARSAWARCGTFRPHAEHWWKVTALRWYDGRGCSAPGADDRPAGVTQRRPVRARRK